MTIGQTGTVKIVTAAADPAVELSVAKWHLRVDHDDDDDLIEGLLAAAERHAAAFTGRAFVDTTFDLVLAGFSGGAIEIPNPPLIEIVGVFYDDGDGNELELPATDYAIDASVEPAMLTSSSWPSAGPARVRFRAGYIDNQPDPPVGEVPQDIQAGILLILNTLYENRQNMIVGQTVAMMPWGSEQLLRPHRIWTAIG